jgi:hypothetical protein
MIDRRAFLRLPAAIALAGAAYSVAIEPNFRLEVTRYRVTPKDWPPALSLRIAVITDLHACEPWMPPARIRRIAALANSLAPDLIVLLGDFAAGTHLVTGPVQPEQWAEALSNLEAPLGVHAVLGNHDWWHGALPGDPSDGAEAARAALKQMGARLYENDAMRLEKNGEPFWVLGLADQLAEWVQIGKRGRWRGRDDLDATLARVIDDSPAILLAHEPFVFDRVPGRVALTLSGHTHGGQVNLPVLGPIAAELRYGGGSRVYGHYVQDGRHLVISGGLGESILPMRFMRPPEIVEVTVAPPAAA